MKKMSLEEQLGLLPELANCRRCEGMNEISRAYFGRNVKGVYFYHIIYQCGHHLIYDLPKPKDI